MTFILSKHDMRQHASPLQLKSNASLHSYASVVFHHIHVCTGQMSITQSWKSSLRDCPEVWCGQNNTNQSCFQINITPNDNAHTYARTYLTSWFNIMSKCLMHVLFKKKLRQNIFGTDLTANYFQWNVPTRHAFCYCALFMFPMDNKRLYC